MLDLMYDNDGVGLAAPQVGIAKRLLVLDWERDPADLFGKARILVNPVITHRSSETNVSKEGCLSLPGVLIDVERSNTIQVDYQTLAGEPVHFTVSDFPARIVQHEVDHLDGTVMLKYLTRSKKMFMAVPQGEEK
jgi:peptide deformylase